MLPVSKWIPGPMFTTTWQQPLPDLSSILREFATILERFLSTGLTALGRAATKAEAVARLVVLEVELERVQQELHHTPMLSSFLIVQRQPAPPGPRMEGTARTGTL